MLGLIPNRRPSFRVSRNINHDLPQKFSVPIKYLDATIPPVRHINISLRIHSDTVRSIELPRPTPRLTPRLNPISILIHLRNSRIHVTVADVSIPSRVPRHIRHLAEQSVLRRQRRVSLFFHAPSPLSPPPSSSLPPPP